MQGIALMVVSCACLFLGLSRTRYQVRNYVVSRALVGNVTDMSQPYKNTTSLIFPLKVVYALALHNHQDGDLPAPYRPHLSICRHSLPPKVHALVPVCPCARVPFASVFPACPRACAPLCACARILLGLSLPPRSHDAAENGGLSFHWFYF